MGDGTFLSLVWALLAICAVLLGAYWFTRHVVGRLPVAGRLRGRRIRVLEQVPVGRDQKLLLVQVGDQVHLIGTAQGGISCLWSVPKEEVERWRQEAEEQTPAGPGFEQALRDVLRQQEKK